MNQLMFMSLAALAIATVTGQLAQADEAKVDSEVTAVTLYRNQAMVTRTLALKGAAGSKEIVVGDLPENIVSTSLFAEGGEKVEVRAVRFRTRAAGESPRKEVREIQAKLRANQQKIQLVAKKTQLLKKRAEYLDKMETFSAKTANSDLDRGVLDAEALEKLTTFSFGQRTKIVEEEVALETESYELQQEQELLTRQLNEVTNSSAKTIREAVLYIEKEGGGDHEVSLSYLVNSCGWSPTYTVRAEENAEVAKVEYNGLIQQMSGEDWQGVKLTLSTASPALSAAGPGLAPFRVALASPAANGPMVQANQADGQGQVMLHGKAKDIKALLSQQQAAIYANQNAISLEDNFKTSWGLNDAINVFACAQLTSDTSVALTKNRTVDPAQQPSFHYQLKSSVTLPSRNNQQIVRILQTELPSQFYHVATPILTSYVYREAELNNTSQTDLLAGPITVYLDDRFVGRGEIPTVARGQEFVVGFGADSQLRTRRELVDKSNGINGGNRETKIKYRLIIENYKETETEIRVVDRIPMANETDNLRVTLLPVEVDLSDDEAYARIERPKGILRWDTKVPSRAIGTAAHEIEYGFTMEYDRNYVVTLPQNLAQQEEEFNELQNFRYNRR